MANTPMMTCYNPESANDGNNHNCPVTYCPPNPLNPQVGNFSAASCLFDGYISSSGESKYRIACIKKDVCNMHMNCSQLAYDITGLPQIGLENPTDWGKQGLRLVANGCEAGNFSDSNNAEFKYSTVNSIEYAIPSPTFSSPTSAANGLNTSSLFVYMLIALLLMNLTRKLSN